MDIWKFHEDNLSGLIDHLQSKTNRQHRILVKARAELLNMKKIKWYVNISVDNMSAQAHRF